MRCKCGNNNSREITYCSCGRKVIHRKRRKKSWEIIQTHHLSYEPEITAIVTRTEHFFAGRMDNYGKAHGFSPGFCRTLRYMIKKHRRSAWRKIEKNLEKVLPIAS
jgi:hypothetical protein